MTSIVYDHFIAFGGAERVCLYMSKMLPNSILESAYVDEEKFSEHKIKNHLCNYKDSFFPTLKLIFFYLLLFRPQNRNLVVANGVFSPILFCFGMYQKKVIYFHTFPTFSVNTVRSSRTLKDILFIGVGIFYRLLLKVAVKRADHVFCNSLSVQKRFADIYINAEVLYPPIDTLNFNYKESKGYYLVLSRLEPNKQVDIILDAFIQMPEKTLFIVGSGSCLQNYSEKVKKWKNIVFLGEKSSNDVVGLLANCEAVINIPQNEYFGMVPVEALASGKFVIGAREGGMLETITNEKLGVLLKPPISPEDIKEAIRIYEYGGYSKKDLIYRIEYAKNFDLSKFEMLFKRAIDEEF